MALEIKAISDLTNDTSFTSLSWKENPSAKKLLDVLVFILKEEYIKIAKENPEIFSR